MKFKWELDDDKSNLNVKIENKMSLHYIKYIKKVKKKKMIWKYHTNFSMSV